MNEILKSSPGAEIRTARIMNASRELVFKAWTDPEHLKNWWGPEGFTNTFHEYDLRPGGKWIFIMHGPDGRDYPNESVFVKIDAPRFIAWDHLFNPEFQVQTEFEELPGNKTNLVFKMVFSDAEVFGKLKDFIKEKNEENMDKLEAELLKMQPGN